MHAEQTPSRSDDIDLVTLGRAVWRARGWIVGLALAAGFVTFVALSMMRPVYTSEARILIEKEESAYRRPADDQRAPATGALDEQAIESQVQVLTSRDLILKVVKELDLTNNPEFAEDAGIGLIQRLLRQLGVTSEKSQLAKAATAFAEKLSIYQLGKSSVIAVAYTSGDPDLAAKAANSLARVYIEWQREAKLEQTRDATAWLRSQIDALRERVAESEAAVEEFRAEEGIYTGSNDVDLSAQQLSELNSKLILAKAQKSEAEARARMIHQILSEDGDIEAISEVLKSPLVSRLTEQRVQVQRQLAELSATLLPSHPRIQQLHSELGDVRTQIRDEARKIARSLESEAEVADARVESLTSSLKAAKSEASGDSAAEIKLRALQREAKSNRDLLESYLARYRDASARGDVGAVPANATIVSQAYPSSEPSFPKKLPITLLVMVAVALVVLAWVMARELIRATSLATASQPQPVKAIQERQDNGRREERKEGEAVEDAPSSPADAGADPKAEPRPQIRSLQTVLSRFGRPNANGQAADDDSERSYAAAASGAANANGRGGDAPLSAAAQPWPALPTALKHFDTPEEREELQMSPLDRYLRQRSAASSLADTATGRGSPASDEVIRNLDVLKDRLAGRLDTQKWPVALITPVSASSAVPEAIALARPLAASSKTVVLLDIAQGASTVSEVLGLKRCPGFNELLANAAAFDDVLRVDSETPLQVIPAGKPDLTAPPSELKSFVRILDALRQTYDYVLIHSDFARTEHFAPALHGELATAVALFAANTVEQEDERLEALKALGCPFVLYELTLPAEEKESGGLRQRLAAT